MNDEEQKHNAHIDDFDEGPLTISERKRLRRILQDDMYARKFRTTLKVWVITLGTVASMMVAAMTVWKEVLARLYK